MKAPTLALLLLGTAALASDSPTWYHLEILIESLPHSSSYRFVQSVTTNTIASHLYEYPWQERLLTRKGNGWDLSVRNDGRGRTADFHRSNQDRQLSVVAAGKTNDYSFYLFYGRAPGMYSRQPRFIQVAKLDEVVSWFTAFVAGEMVVLDSEFIGRGQAMQKLPVEFFGVIQSSEESEIGGFLDHRKPAPGGIQVIEPGRPATNQLILPAPLPH